MERTADRKDCLVVGGAIEHRINSYYRSIPKTHILSEMTQTNVSVKLNDTMASRLNKMIVCLALLFPAIIFCGCSSDGGGSDNTPNTVTVSAANSNMPSAGVLTAQYDDSPKGQDISKVVDGNVTTKFTTNNSRFYLLWDGNSSVSVNSYSLTSADDAPEKDPASWTVYGSTDNTNWTVLDSRAGQVFSKRQEQKEYAFTNEIAFKYIKFEIENNNGSASTQIAEFALKWVPADISDLMRYATGNSYSPFTPMGNHYAHRHVTIDEDREWLNTAANEPPVPATNEGNLSWGNRTVTLYPYGTPSPADVNQHSIGDCSALAVFASFAYIYPDFVKSLITDNGDGTYSVAMFDPQGLPVTVTVTSRFLIDAKGDIGASTGKNGVATWATVLEKAIMKWNCIYQANPDINGIGSEQVAPLFTGDGGSFAFDRGKLSSSQLARAVKYCLEQGKIVVGGFSPGGLYVGNYQTVSAHAFTLMHSAYPTSMFAMRNPWGFSPTSNGYDGSADGILNIPTNGPVLPTIDLRIMEPGIAAETGAGTTTPYIPPVFPASPENVRVSAEILRRAGVLVF